MRCSIFAAAFLSASIFFSGTAYGRIHDPTVSSSSTEDGVSINTDATLTLKRGSQEAPAPINSSQLRRALQDPCLLEAPIVEPPDAAVVYVSWYADLIGSKPVISLIAPRSRDLTYNWELICPSDYDRSETYLINAGADAFVDARGPGSALCDVEVEVCNGCACAPKETIMVAIVDPDDGSIIGQGSIYSDDGSYAYYPLDEGTASFRFSSMYTKGKSVPKGYTKFEFKKGGFRFRSTSIEWFVITGSDCAKYKGEGEIFFFDFDGGISPGFGFILTACDGAGKNKPDTFRIKIWEKESGDTFYDNKMGLENDSYEGTAIEQGGFIRIMQNKKPTPAPTPPPTPPPTEVPTALPSASPSAAPTKTGETKPPTGIRK